MASTILFIVAVPALSSCVADQVDAGNKPPSSPELVRGDATTQPSPGPIGATPEHLRIPAIHVSTVVVKLGLNRDRTVQVPRNPDTAGWFDRGPVPGQLGSSVVLGHVDSTHGPAVFYRLSRLEPGNQVHVRLSDGAVTSFVVVRVVTYRNRDFPARAVYAGTPRRRTLKLVTCGGAYDPHAGGYQSNVVVYTKHLQGAARR